jgi:anti-anti-sigma regulatory factor
MQISFSKQEGRVPVTVMHLEGNLDASNYTEVIARAQDAYDQGARDLLIDLSKVPYVSSAGLMSLHSMALIFTGQSLKTKEAGRPTFRSINAQNDDLVRQHMKLFNPQTDVQYLLDVVGLKQLLDVFTDLEAAVQSF